jgi:hypothetical protein
MTLTFKVISSRGLLTVMILLMHLNGELGEEITSLGVHNYVRIALVWCCTIMGG